MLYTLALYTCECLQEEEEEEEVILIARFFEIHLIEILPGQEKRNEKMDFDNLVKENHLDRTTVHIALNRYSP